LGNRADAVTAFGIIAAGTGRIDTTMGRGNARLAGTPSTFSTSRRSSLVDVAQRDARVEKCPFEGERAAQEERDEVVAPERRDVGDFVGEHAILVDTVLRQVGPEIGARPQRRQGRASPRR
jgi:hypothetical protein